MKIEPEMMSLEERADSCGTWMMVGVFLEPDLSVVLNMKWGLLDLS
jgi:hypothetical protein